MIYLFYGSDAIRARSRVQKTVEVAKKKHTGAELFKLTVDNFSIGKLDELITSQGLFYSAFIVLVDNLFLDKDIGEIILKKIKEIKESPNFFIFLEKELIKKDLEKFQKYAQKIEEYKKVERKLNKKEVLALKGEKVDFFDFTNALGERNKKKLWTLYQDALEEEVPSEEIHAMFFWQTKAMLSALKSNSALEAGLNPFVFNKSKAYAKNYGQTIAEIEKKLKEISLNLFDMYHLAHQGKIDFAIALEKFILNL